MDYIICMKADQSLSFQRIYPLILEGTRLFNTYGQVVC